MEVQMREDISVWNSRCHDFYCYTRHTRDFEFSLVDLRSWTATNGVLMLVLRAPVSETVCISTCDEAHATIKGVLVASWAKSV